MNKNIFLSLLTLSLVLFSCKTTDKASDLGYMQDIEQIATQTAINTSNTTLKEGDQLVIVITAKDMDVVKPFNQNYSSGEITNLSLPSSNTPAQGQSSVAGPTYIVDTNGQIDFPTLGKLQVAGKNLVEFQDDLRRKLTYYIKDPSVNVKITNFKITVLGEVAKPGQYIIADGQATMLTALGLAGDLTMYGKRDDVLIVRNEGGQITKQRVNMLKADFINSEFFNLKQGDVIYVSPNQTKEKTARLDPNMPIYISVAGIVVTILALVFKK
ncbi:polysaccharide export protein [Chryseobacterium sp. SNU WT5]|uniref:polysaccharide biosynthesis/export family protein n=1 Tax=Chryseobacterium sp. SNU WT5 TaxID=2594269 RepID=UPI0011801159|nr:polysaccharide biosynthesis/export family protein [Chryseobacterium sp. SNU WT5]QDP85831.1 polysaccharide export protein [Chryseobacterium sp. SNU WT5]